MRRIELKIGVPEGQQELITNRLAAQETIEQTALADKLDRDGSVTLTADWDIGDGRSIRVDEIKARDGDGLKLYDDGGNGIFVEDGGQVGIGTTSPFGDVEIVNDGSFSSVYITSYRDSAGTHGFLVGRGARGSESSPSAVANGDELFRFLGNGYNGTSFHAGCAFAVLATENFSGSAGGSQIIFRTTANGSTTRSDRLTIDHDGEVGIGTTSPTAALDVNGDTIRLRTSKTPPSASAAGNQGDIAWDSNYLYVCTATNTWKRTALSTW